MWLFISQCLSDFFFFLLPKVELHVCVVYLVRITKSEYSCSFCTNAVVFACKAMDIELLFSHFYCTCVNSTTLFSYLFLKQKRHFSIKLLKINWLLCHYSLHTVNYKLHNGTSHHLCWQISECSEFDGFKNIPNVPGYSSGRNVFKLF